MCSQGDHPGEFLTALLYAHSRPLNHQLGFWPSSLEGHVERAASRVFPSHLRAISFQDERSNYQGIKHISPPSLQLASCIKGRPLKKKFI